MKKVWKIVPILTDDKVITCFCYAMKSKFDVCKGEVIKLKLASNNFSC